MAVTWTEFVISLLVLDAALVTLFTLREANKSSFRPGADDHAFRIFHRIWMDPKFHRQVLLKALFTVLAAAGYWLVAWLGWILAAVGFVAFGLQLIQIAERNS